MISDTEHDLMNQKITIIFTFLQKTWGSGDIWNCFFLGKEKFEIKKCLNFSFLTLKIGFAQQMYM